MPFSLGGSAYGYLLAIGSSISYAFYMVYLEKTRLTHLEPLLLSFYIGIFIAIETLMVHLFTLDISFFLPIPAYLYLILLAICSSFLAVVWLQKGIRMLGSTMASLFCLFEPITSLIVGVLFLSETLTIAKVIGSLFILMALIIMTKQTAPLPDEAVGAENETT